MKCHIAINKTICLANLTDEELMLLIEQCFSEKHRRLLIKVAIENEAINRAENYYR